MRRHFCPLVAFLALAPSAAACAAPSDPVAESGESSLTQDELGAKLVSEGFHADGRELHKVEIVKSERDAPSGMTCILDNENWAFGRICYFVYEHISESKTIETYADRFVHPDGRIAYAIDGHEIGPFKMGVYPVWGRWATKSDGDPAASGFSCDAWSSFSVDLRDFRAAQGFSVRVLVDGGRFPDPFPSSIESQFFGVEQWLTAQASTTALETKKTFAEGPEKGELALTVTTDGSISLRLEKTRQRAPDQIAPWSSRTYVFAGGGGPMPCALVSCSAESGASVDLSPTGFYAEAAKQTCGPIRTQSGYPAYFLPRWTGSTCDPKHGIVAFAFDGALPRGQAPEQRSFGIASLDGTTTPAAIGATTRLDLRGGDERDNVWAPLPDGQTDPYAFVYSRRGYDVIGTRPTQYEQEYWRDLYVSNDEALLYRGIPLAMRLGEKYCAEYYDSGRGGTNYDFHTRKPCTYPQRNGEVAPTFYGDPTYFEEHPARPNPECAPVRVE